MKEMERLTVPEPKYMIQAMDTPLVMDNDDDQRGLGYQNTLVRCLLNKFQSVCFFVDMQIVYIKYSRSRAQGNAAGDNYLHRCVV